MIMKRLKYHVIEPVDRHVAEAALRRDDPDELLFVVLSVALHEPDPEWAQEFCLRLSSHPHFNVRGNAVLGLGHIARIHGELDPARAKPVIEAALRDEHEFVRGQAHSAKDDAELFLKWSF